MVKCKSFLAVTIIIAISIFSVAFLLQEFLTTNPILSEFKAEINKFESLETKISDIEESITVGAIDLYTGRNGRACMHIASDAWSSSV